MAELVDATQDTVIREYVLRKSATVKLTHLQVRILSGLQKKFKKMLIIIAILFFIIGIILLIFSKLKRTSDLFIIGIIFMIVVLLGLIYGLII